MPRGAAMLDQNAHMTEELAMHGSGSVVAPNKHAKHAPKTSQQHAKTHEKYINS